MTPQHYAMLDEQRTSSRFERDPDDSYAVISIPEQGAGRAQVLEESLGGISLILDDCCGLGVGQAVDIAFLDSPLRGVVRHIEPYDDGRFLVGFECEPASRLG